MHFKTFSITNKTIIQYNITNKTIIQLVIRATIPHMQVLYIGESTSSISSIDGKTGKLKTFLERHFKDQVLLETITKWFQTIGNASDYSNAYRQYRQATFN